MKVLILLAFLVSCSDRPYQVRVQTREVADGYVCQNSFGSVVRICKEMAECNDYCDQINKQAK